MTALGPDARRFHSQWRMARPCFWLRHLHRDLSRLASALLVAVAFVSAASAETLTGTALIRERIALPPGATLEAVIEDVALADAPAIVLGRTENEALDQSPIGFSIDYDPAALDPRAI